MIDYLVNEFVYVQSASSNRTKCHGVSQGITQNDYPPTAFCDKTNVPFELVILDWKKVTPVK